MSHDDKPSLVDRAVQRLRDNIERRESTEDVEALKAVLLEMSTQKERADRWQKIADQRAIEVADLKVATPSSDLPSNAPGWREVIAAIKTMTDEYGAEWPGAAQSIGRQVYEIADLALRAGQASAGKLSINEVPLCAGHAETWFCERDRLAGDTSCAVCAFNATPSAGGLCKAAPVEVPGIGAMQWCEPCGLYFGKDQECPSASSAARQQSVRRFRLIETGDGAEMKADPNGAYVLYSDLSASGPTDAMVRAGVHAAGKHNIPNHECIRAVYVAMVEARDAK